MRTLIALVVKFVMTLAAAGIAGYFVGITNWFFLLMVALVGTVVNYILGDLFVLPAAGNIIASLGDGIMAGLIGYIMAVRNRAVVENALLFALIFGVIVAVGEYFFHKYLAKDRKVAPNPR